MGYASTKTDQFLKLGLLPCVHLWTLQVEVRSKLMNIQLLHSRPVNSCESIRISRGLIFVQRFQLIHASSCCADSVGVRFVGICTWFCTHINEHKVKEVGHIASMYTWCSHGPGKKVFTVFINMSNSNYMFIHMKEECSLSSSACVNMRNLALLTKL